MAYKLVKKDERKYYKYSYESWEQPLLSENGIMGRSKFAVDQSSYLGTNVLAWKAFDADNTNSSDCWHSANGHPAWIGWYNPNPLKITSIQVRNRNSDGSYIKTYNLSYSDNGTTYTDIITGATSPSQSAFAYWTITVPETDAHKYWRLVCTASSGSNSAYTAIQTITITATQYMPVESDETDYDYYEDVTSYKLVKDAGTPTQEVAWTQPPFADWIGNNDGVWDTSRLYTCTCDGSHNPTDQGGVASLAGSNNGWHTTTAYLPHWVGYYTDPIRVSKFGFQVDGTTTYIPTAFHWDGSNDGSTWTTLGSFNRNNTLTTSEEYTIPEANRGMYKYHRLYIRSGNNSKYCFICNVNITATKEEEGTPDTYYVISRE